MNTTQTSFLMTSVTSLALIAKQKQDNEDVSPVTLNYNDMSRMSRLLLLSSLSVIGSIGNVFMISSFFIEDHLKKTGNVFIVNVALADFLITSLLIPASAIVLLANIHESVETICKFQWFLAATAFLVTVLSLATTSIENYMRLCTTQEWFNKTNTTIILLTIWFICSISSGLQFVFNLSFDYCTRKSNGIIPYQAAIIALLIVLPLLLTFYTHIRIIFDCKRFMKEPHFKPSLAYQWNLSLVRTNFYSYILFIMFWLPFGFVLCYSVLTYGALTKSLSNRLFYNTAWIGLSKSCVHNVIYCISNRHFQNAYVNLFHYCCCKTTVSTARRQRQETRCTTSDVRVHIIPGYGNMYSPQRAGSSGNKRDIHEL